MILTCITPLNYIYNVKVIQIDPETKEESIWQENVYTIDELKTERIVNIINGIICLILIFYTIRKQLKELYNAIIYRSLAGWHVIDTLSLVLNFIYIIKLIVICIEGPEQIEYEERAFFITVGAYATFLMWVRIFKWMKFFERTSYYVSQIWETAKATTGFLVLFGLCILAFANFFF